MLRRMLVMAMTVTLGLGLAITTYTQSNSYTLPTFAQDPYTPNPNCSPNSVPAGQANPSSEPEPMRPIWCFNLTNQQPTTFTSGANDWVDNFQTNVQMGRLNDGDLGYRVYDMVNTGNSKTQHFVNNNHWMDDNAGGSEGGAMLRPNRSFTFENGKLVVEADVAAGIPDYQGFVWPEITVSMAPQPTGDIVDNLYAYGHFGGFWTVGCRLHPAGNPICSVESANKDITATNNSYPCFQSAPSRVMEISDFEICGSTHWGGNRGSSAGQFWRQCQPNQMDMFCRDRFRMEITKSSLTIYVNGQPYFQDANWAPKYQLPDSMVNGGQVYAYFSDWQDSPSAPAYRFHWGRLAINPHNPNGSPAAPSTAPSFCLGMPQNTCAMSDGGGSMTPTPTATPVPPKSTATPIVTPTPTPTPRPTSTPTQPPIVCLPVVCK